MAVSELTGESQALSAPNATTAHFPLSVIPVGLLAAIASAFLLCRLPDPRTDSPFKLFILALVYVAVGALAGAAGTWLSWKNSSSPYSEIAPLPFPLLALVCATGWVWVPSIVLLCEQVSPAAALVAMVAALVLASGLRSTACLIFVSSDDHSSKSEYADAELFADSLYRAPVEAHGYIIAIGLYAASAALCTHSNYIAAALLAFTAFLFAWRITIPRNPSFPSRWECKRAAQRLARVTAPAVLVTVWALLAGVAHRSHVVVAGAATGAIDSGKTPAFPDRKTVPYGPGGFESLILWPFPEKKQIIPPIAVENPLLAPGSTRPLVIRFDGVYRYIQPPDRAPGPTAHKAHGTPLEFDIGSNNGLPLVMDAHQDLATSIPIKRCRQIEVRIANSDNRKGAVSLGVLLEDRSSRQTRTLYLGQQPILSTEPGYFFIKSTPLLETIEFAVPPNPKIRNFSEITVVVLPDVEHSFVAPKIAIRQFQLLPR